MTKKRKQINLLPSAAFGKSLPGRVFSWSLTAGRYIIVATELIVIIAFLFRFKLDIDAAGLNDSIKEKQAIINSFGELEGKIRFLQRRLAIIKEFEGTQMQSVETLENLSQITPSDIYLTEFSLNKNAFTAEGVALNDTSLSIFLSGLQESEKFTEINLTSLTAGSPENPKIKFSLKVGIE